MLKVLMSIIILSSAMCGFCKVYRAHDPAWLGEWIWAPRKENAPVVDVNLRRYLERKPGGWSTSLVNRVIGNASVAGLYRFYWRTDDGYGNLLYPAKNKAKILCWPNWGVDFGKFDFPAYALSLSRRLNLELILVALPENMAEVKGRYPDAKVIGVKDIPAGVMAAFKIKPSKLAMKWMDHKPYIFEKTFEVSDKVENAKICLTAHGTYKLRLDNVKIGSDSDWWRGETYDVSSRLKPGKHTITVEVSPDKIYAGLLLNMKWKDVSGVHVLNTGKDWRCRRPGTSKWFPVSTPGLEGIGPWFRLKEVWQNPRQVYADIKTEYRLVDPETIKVRVSCRKNLASKICDGSKENASHWQANSLPATVVLTLPRAISLEEIRIYPGNTDYFGNPSGISSLRDYRIYYRDNGHWKLLIAPVKNARKYRGEKTNEYVFCHAFTPREIKEIKLVISKTYDTGMRMRSPQKVCVPASKRVGFVREIELLKSLEEK
jgi:hypothetical protein